MPAELSDELKQVLDQPTFVTLVTVQPDGSPQASPVWVKRDGEELLISTTQGRRKERNLRRDPRASVVVQPFDDPYRYAEIRGTATVGEPGTAEANALIDELSHKYTGRAYGEFNPDAAADGPRVVVRLTPRKVVGRL